MLQVCMSLMLYGGGDLTLTSPVTVLPRLACWTDRTDCVLSENIDYEGWDMTETVPLPDYSGPLTPDVNLLWMYCGG